MHFVLQTPSLQNIAQVKIVTTLWTQKDIFTQLTQYSFKNLLTFELSEDEQQWKEMEEQVRSKVPDLPLPQLCKKKLLNDITPIGMEIIRWCLFHKFDGYSIQFLDTLLPQQLCWTMHRTIDYAKTAELMVKDGRLSIESRYEVACLNCLEDAARQLIKSICEERKTEYVYQMKALLKLGRIEYKHLILTYFTCTLTATSHALNGFLQSWSNNVVIRILFKGVLLNGDGAMCEYWFTKLSQEKKEEVLKDMELQLMSLKQSRASSFLYYVSLMNEEQRRRMFRECASDVLKCLLRCPMQSLFMEAAVSGLSFLSKDDYSSVVYAIINKIRVDFHDPKYCQLFWEFWRSSPAEYKQHFLNDTDHLECLIATKREEFIQLCLKQAPSHQLKELVENRYDNIRQVLMDESVISDAALTICKETAELNNSNDKENEEKGSKRKHVGRIVDLAIESRMKRRRLD